MQNKNDIVDQLLEIGITRMEQVTLDLVQLTEVMQKCQTIPGIDSTIGSFGSIIYRICEAFKTTTTLSGRVDRATVDGLSPQEIAEIQALLEHISETIESLINSNLVFLSCDVDTLSAHPEVAKVPEVQTALSSVRNQIWDIEEKLWYIGKDAKSLFKYAKFRADAPAFAIYGAAWQLMQHTIGRCVRQAKQINGRERAFREGSPVLHPKPDK